MVKAAAVLGGLVGILVLAWVLFLSSIFFPSNVSEQWRFAYEYNRSLIATSQNVCQARKDEAAATDPTVKSQRGSQRIAYEQNYRRIEAEYDARLANAFEAKLVRPADVPLQAPTLEQELLATCQ